MTKPIRLMIYLAIIGFTIFMLAPALSLNTAKIGGPIRDLFSSLNMLAVAAIIFSIALIITYLITSGWGLILLGVVALLGLIVLAIIHPYIMPLLIPMFALWIACAMARRREAASH